MIFLQPYWLNFETQLLKNIKEIPNAIALGGRRQSFWKDGKISFLMQSPKTGEIHLLKTFISYYYDAARGCCNVGFPKIDEKTAISNQSTSYKYQIFETPEGQAAIV